MRQKAEISFDEPLNVDWEGNVLLLSDVLGTDSDVIYKDVESGAEREILAESFARLGEREKKILRLRFFEGRTQMEVAGEIGISQAQGKENFENALRTFRGRRKNAERNRGGNGHIAVVHIPP